MGGSNTMERRCSGETLPKNDDQSDSSSIKSDVATSRGTKTRDTMTDILDDAKGSSCSSFWISGKNQIATPMNM
jgi:hypothetical protein